MIHKDLDSNIHLCFQKIQQLNNENLTKCNGKYLNVQRFGQQQLIHVLSQYLNDENASSVDGKLQYFHVK